MPTYVSKCSACGKDHEYVAKVANRAATPVCCGLPTERQLTTPAISAMAWTGHKGVYLPDGKNGGKGTWIEDGAAYKQYMKSNNKISGDEGQQEAAIQKRNLEKADDKKLTQAVEKAVAIHSH
jgi:predicted nucleic acid-binding Zn ribbon protein